MQKAYTAITFGDVFFERNGDIFWLPNKKVHVLYKTYTLVVGLASIT